MNKEYFDRKIKAYKQVRDYIYEPYFSIIEIALLIIAVLAFVGAIFMTDLVLEFYALCIIALTITVYRIFKKYKTRLFIESRPDLSPQIMNHSKENK
jgi:hypothetical protein